MAKPIVVSGMQPTGRLHLGNYLGALKNFVDLQNSGKYQCYFFIADLHALTEGFPSKDLQKQILELASDYLAAGLDPKKSVIFQQSQIPAHSELAWIFETSSPLGELERMTQYKDKSASQKQNINAGLLTYPALMAADILLYDADFVPTGDDQDQHLELTRTLARKFNARFPARQSPDGSRRLAGGGETFKEPKNLHTAMPRVMSLKNPAKKMSKSDPASCLFLDDSPAEIKAKIQAATTDSGSEIKFNFEQKPGVSNLLKIYESLSGEPVTKLEKQFAGKTYSEFKSELANLIANYFSNFREQKKKLLVNSHKLKVILDSGSQKAAKVANAKIAQVKDRVGLTL